MITPRLYTGQILRRNRNLVIQLVIYMLLWEMSSFQCLNMLRYHIVSTRQGQDTKSNPGLSPSTKPVPSSNHSKGSRRGQVLLTSSVIRPLPARIYLKAPSKQSDTKVWEASQVFIPKDPRYQYSLDQYLRRTLDPTNNLRLPLAIVFLFFFISHLRKESNSTSP